MVSCIAGNKSFLPVKGFRWSTMVKNIRNKFLGWGSTCLNAGLPVPLHDWKTSRKLPFLGKKMSCVSFQKVSLVGCIWTKWYNISPEICQNIWHHVGSPIYWPSTQNIHEMAGLSPVHGVDHTLDQIRDGDLQCITASQYSQGMVSCCLMSVEQFLRWNPRFEMEYSWKRGYYLRICAE